ncbi:hypothetical protein [Nostoc sp.]
MVALYPRLLSEGERLRRLGTLFYETYAIAIALNPSVKSQFKLKAIAFPK